MKDFSGWIKYLDPTGATVIGIRSPNEQEARLLIDLEVAAWLAVPGNSAKLI